MAINNRQKSILEFVDTKQKASAQEVISHLVSSGFEKASKATVLRDIALLLEKDLIKKVGSKRNVIYKTKTENPLLKYFDVKEYYKTVADLRTVKENYQPEILPHLESLFSDREIKHLTSLNNEYQKRKAKLSETALRKEFERITIEFTWKSSRIEGNTYSLVDTEVLIKQNKPAPGHSKEETQMILNHKEAVEYIFSKPKVFEKISAQKIRTIHSLAVKDLGIETGLRKSIVGITGTKYKPIDNQHQISDAISQTCRVINRTKEPISKALIGVLMISYIQPFMDGNKRTARITSNALLNAYNWAPISYRSVDEAEYKKAMLLFYEQNSANYFKELFVQQFEFSVNNYFGA
ncbi:Fic family protein [Patescibacteria group bacterium]|nr:Fic family protein [Patescibacteria group bacterium]